MKGILQDMEKAEGQIILFIDEVHTLIGAGATEGAMDAANLLKPAFARGTFIASVPRPLANIKSILKKMRLLKGAFNRL